MLKNMEFFQYTVPKIRSKVTKKNVFRFSGGTNTRYLQIYNKHLVYKHNNIHRLHACTVHRYKITQVSVTRTQNVLYM